MSWKIIWNTRAFFLRTNFRYETDLVWSWYKFLSLPNLPLTQKSKMVAIIFSRNILSSRSQNHCRLKQSFDSVSLLYTLSESSFFYLTFFSISGHSRYFYTFVICSNSSRCVTSSWCCVIVNNCSLAHKRTPQAPSTKMRPPCTSC